MHQKSALTGLAIVLALLLSRELDAQIQPNLRTNASTSAPAGGMYVPPGSLYDNGQSDGVTSLASQNSSASLTARSADDFHVASGNCASRQFEVSRIRVQMVQSNAAPQPFALDLYDDDGSGNAPVAGITPRASFPESVQVLLGAYDTERSLFEVSFLTPGLLIEGDTTYWLAGFGASAAANTTGFNNFSATAVGAPGTVANAVIIAPSSGVPTWTPVQQVIGGVPVAFSFAVDGSCHLLPADLAITMTNGAAALIPGMPVTYTLVASNNGPAAATGATVADTFAAPLVDCTWTCSGAGGGACMTSGVGNILDTVDIPVGAVLTYVASCGIPASAIGGVSDTAFITAPPAMVDPNSSNNSVTDSDPLTPQADLSMALAATPNPVTAGASLTYTATLTSTGPSDASGTSISVPLPADTTLLSANVSGGGNCSGLPVVCSVPGSLAPGGTRVATLVLTVAPGAPTSAAIAAIATAASTTPDPTPGNNSAGLSIGVIGSADLQFDLVASAAQTQINMPVTFTASSRNLGPSDARDVSISVSLLPDFRYVSHVADAGAVCTAPQVGTTGVVRCVWAGATAAGAVRGLQVVAVSAVQGLSGANGATDAGTTDPVAGNNLDQVVVQVGDTVAAIPALGPAGLATVGLLLSGMGWVTLRSPRRRIRG